jgi:drug/metabolite transporter (DMT)-like permease
MVTNIPREMYNTLALGLVVGSINVFAVYYCVMFLPVVIVTLVSNLTPLILALLSYLIYKVKLTGIEVGVLIMSFVGFIILISGSFSGGSETAHEN